MKVKFLNNRYLLEDNSELPLGVASLMMHDSFFNTKEEMRIINRHEQLFISDKVHGVYVEIPLYVLLEKKDIYLK